MDHQTGRDASLNAMPPSFTGHTLSCLGMWDLYSWREDGVSPLLTPQLTYFC